MDTFDNRVFTSPARLLQNGTIVFNDWKIPSDQKGGEYQVKVEFLDSIIPTAFRKIRVGSYEQPDLFVTCDFSEETYVPGDEVTAKIKVKRPDGKRLSVGSSLAYNVAGTGISKKNIYLNIQGEETIVFTIPSDFDMKVLTLSVSTYLGYTQEKETSVPFVTSHSVSMAG